MFESENLYIKEGVIIHTYFQANKSNRDQNNDQEKDELFQNLRIKRKKIFIIKNL